MKDWVIILTFTYPHEAHFAKSKLDSEGISTLIQDELTAQVYNFISNAVGGVKLLVKKTDYEKAYKILINSGYIKEKKISENTFLKGLDKITSKIPLIGKSILEMRLIIIVTILLTIIIVPLSIKSLPSKLELLKANSWCVEKIIYNGKILEPYSLETYGQSIYENCSETMSFRENGILTLPGIYSYGERASWEFKNDSLYITEWSLEDKNNAQKSIYHGVYYLEIDNNYIKMQSDSLTIYGKVYILDF